MQARKQTDFEKKSHVTLAYYMNLEGVLEIIVIFFYMNKKKDTVDIPFLNVGFFLPIIQVIIIIPLRGQKNKTSFIVYMGICHKSHRSWIYQIRLDVRFNRIDHLCHSYANSFLEKLPTDSSKMKKSDAISIKPKTQQHSILTEYESECVENNEIQDEGFNRV